MTNHYTNCQVETLSETPDGTLLVTLRFSDGTAATLPCTFGQLLRWREKVEDTTIVHRLTPRRVDVWVDNGTIVDMETLLRANEHGATPQSPRPRAVSDGERRRSSDASPDTKAMLRRTEALLGKEMSWLRKTEREMLQSFIDQLERGRRLSERQLDCLGKFRDRADERKLPKFYRG